MTNLGLKYYLFSTTLQRNGNFADQKAPMRNMTWPTGKGV